MNKSAGKDLFAAYVVLYSVTAGAYVSLFPTVLAELFGIQHFASFNGLLYMLRGFGTLVGTPGAGALIRNSANESVRSKMDLQTPELVDWRSSH